MGDKKRGASLIVEGNSFSCDKKENAKGREEYIKNLTGLLHNYASHSTLEDVSDFLASSYRHFLMDYILEDLKYCPSRDLNFLIGICLDIIKNNHKTFKYQNIYFICLNTLFLLLNKVNNVNGYMEFLSFIIFCDLIFTNEWTKNSHIEIFAKLNYISLFIISNTFKKYALAEAAERTNAAATVAASDGTDITVFRFKQIIKHVCTEIVADERDNDNDNNDNVDWSSIKNEKLEIQNNEFRENLEHDNSDVDTYFNRIPPVQKHCSLNNSNSIFEKENYKNKRNRVIVFNDEKEVNKQSLYKKIKTANCKEIVRKKRKMITHVNYNFNTISDTISDELIFKIYNTVIHLAIKHDLTIYIIHECVNIVLKLCKLCNHELVVFDFLQLYTYYIKDNRKKSERFIVFVLELIAKCKNGNHKNLFSNLMKNFNLLIHLLYVENSDIRLFAKNCLLSMNFLSSHVKCNNEKAALAQGKDAIIRNTTPTSVTRIEKDICRILNVENEIDRVTNLILFHMSYMHDVISNKYAQDEKWRDIANKYDNFYKNTSGQNCLLKNYIIDQIKTKKEKLFYKYNNMFDKKTIIRNNIIEIENMIKTFDCLFSLLSDRSCWNVYFIFFFINMLKSIKKLSKNQPYEFSNEFSDEFSNEFSNEFPNEFPNEFFFLIKNIFIQAIYVFENIAKMEEIWNDQNILTTVEYWYSEKKNRCYNESSKKLLFMQEIIKKACSHLKYGKYSRAEGNSKRVFIILLEDLYLTIIVFLMPKENKWVFFNSSNFYFFKNLLLKISYFYYKNCGSTKTMEFVFFKNFFSRIKKRIKLKYHLKKINTDNLYTNIFSNFKKNKKYLCSQHNYISQETNAHFTFCLDFLKTLLILFDKTPNYGEKEHKYKKLIINICKAPIFTFKFFLTSRSTSNCFSLSVIVLYHLYVSIYKSGKDEKLLHEICVLLFLCCNKALNTIKKDNVIFYSNKLRHGKKKKKKNYKKGRNEYTSTSEKCKTENANYGDCIIIKNDFEKPFKEYYLNSSLYIFITCLNVLTDIVKLTILRCNIFNKDSAIIIKRSKFEKQKKKQYKFLRCKKSLILINYKYMCNMCKRFMKKTHANFFYSTRKYVLNFIQHFISLSTILILKYKLKNNLNIQRIFNFLFYNLFTDYDVSVFTIIYSIAFSLKNYINLCGTKIKKSNNYLEVCDDLISQILDEYYTYDFPETNLWEEYTSKTVSFDSLKQTVVDCPGE
ncbi:conserved Plasmodium protein, unknown function [Plasmodium malariae]|uniref:Uncharacterized protein n=1 Tax=Plasmodium malariae TaxID=5858 RepID=A0A1A8VV54_PLAMA|nr:conserved Plasmodium protein, unknown function [Plasmodium malariae]